MAIILDGKTLARKIEASLKHEIENSGIKTPPKLLVVTVGDDAASEVYVRQKMKAAERCGIDFEQHAFPANVPYHTIAEHLRYSNEVLDADGVILQLPTPFPRDTERKLTNRIYRQQDVDGLVENSRFEPCTPKGIMRLLDEYSIQIAGKHVVIVGRSDIVGKPLARMMLDRDATVTVCHSKTKNIMLHMNNADILVSAVGLDQPWTDMYVNKGATVIDVGISRSNGKLHGDFDFDSVSRVAEYITPVPGGVGPMTVAMLMENTVTAWKRIHKID